MELSGEEKKLQALFSELKTADEETAPRFARVWNRATRGPAALSSSIRRLSPRSHCWFALSFHSQFGRDTDQQTEPVGRARRDTGCA